MSIPLITTGSGRPFITHSRPTPAPLFQEGPNYPLNHIINNHANDPRRTVSNPSILTPPSVILPHMRPKDAREQLGQQPLFTSDKFSDMHVVQELVSLYQAQLLSLETSLKRARAISTSAHERLQSLQHDITHASISTQVTYEAALETVRTLEANKEVLETALKRHKGLLHPIRRLPLEILELIMRFTVENEERDRRNELLFWHDSHLHSRSTTRSNTADMDAYPTADSQQLHLKRHWHRRIPSPLSLSLVCMYWREVATSTPSLWRTVHFQLSGQPDTGSRSWDRVRLFLRRARHDPSGAHEPDESTGTGTGVSLVFTSWVEHGVPSSDARFRKVMKLLSDSDPATREWSAPTPGHSRRTSLVDGGSNGGMAAMTPIPADLDLTRLMPSPPLDRELSSSSSSSSHFRIKRFEMVFDELCDHENMPGIPRNAEMAWPSTSPKPEEVAFIAKDGVYQTPPHLSGELSSLQTPPYAFSLIPWAKEVTLCNLRYRWTIPLDGRTDVPGAYLNLTSLTLLFTRHFPTLLLRPQSNEDLGFLQFLKVAPNLKDLEIRLSRSPLEAVTTASNFSTPSSLVTALPQISTTTASAPVVIHSSITHLTISLQDLFTVIPLFISERSRINAPVILLPSLHHLTLLSHRPGPSSPSPQRDEVQQMAQRLTDFLTITEAKINHLEFATWCGPRGLSKEAFSAIDGVVISDESTQKLQKEEILFALRQFSASETLEVWGNDMTNQVVDLLGFENLSKTPASPPLLPTTTATSLPARTSPTIPAIIDLPLTTSVHTIPPSAIANLDSLSVTPNRHSNSSSPAHSHKRPKKRSMLGAKEIIATVIAAATSSTKRRSLALVGTPEHTPRITINELPIEEDISPTRVSNGTHSPRRSGMFRSPAAGTPELTRVDSNSSGHQRIGVINPGVDTIAVQKEQLLPGIKKLIIHDAADFDLGLAKALVARDIEVVTHG